MAGETQKSTNLTNARSGTKRDARKKEARVVVLQDAHQFAAATELEAADNLIMDIEIRSNDIIKDIAIYNDDLDTGCAPTLVLDFGVAAAADYTSVTSSTATKHSQDDIIDADLFVDGSTEGQAANTVWTSLTPDASTNGPEDAAKEVWELLGYDEDPKTTFNLVVQSQAASSALGAAGDLAVRVEVLRD